MTYSLRRTSLGSNLDQVNLVPKRKLKVTEKGMKIGTTVRGGVITGCRSCGVFGGFQRRGAVKQKHKKK